MQKKFHTTVGREVVSPILLRSYWGVIFSGLFVLALFIIAMLREKVGVYLLGLELLEAIYCICIFYFNIIVWTWLVYCLLVKKAAEILKEHITQVRMIAYFIIVLTRTTEHIRCQIIYEDCINFSIER